MTSGVRNREVRSDSLSRVMLSLSGVPGCHDISIHVSMSQQASQSSTCIIFLSQQLTLNVYFVSLDVINVVKCFIIILLHPSTGLVTTNILQTS